MSEPDQEGVHTVENEGSVITKRSKIEGRLGEALRVAIENSRAMNEALREIRKLIEEDVD